CEQFAPKIATYPIALVDAAIELFSSDNSSLQSVLRQQLTRLPINFLIFKPHCRLSHAGTFNHQFCRGSVVNAIFLPEPPPAQSVAREHCRCKPARRHSLRQSASSSSRTTS